MYQTYDLLYSTKNKNAVHESHLYAGAPVRVVLKRARHRCPRDNVVASNDLLDMHMSMPVLSGGVVVKARLRMRQSMCDIL